MIHTDQLHRYRKHPVIHVTLIIIIEGQWIWLDSIILAIQCHSCQ